MKKLVLVLSLTLLFGVAMQANAQIVPTLPAAPIITGSLDVGAQGSSVSALQQFLIAKGYLQVAAPTGFYGSMTAEAVSAFQGANNLPQVGQVGPKTLSLLQQMFGEGAQQPSAGSQLPTSQQPSNGCSAGDLFNSMTGAPCAQQSSTIAGCTGSNLYSTVTGQLCGGAPQVPQAPQQYEQPVNGNSVVTDPTADPTASISSTGVMLTGQIIGNVWSSAPGTTDQYWFNYGTSSTLAGAIQTPYEQAGFINFQGLFTSTVSGLQPSTTYYYQACLDSTTGTPAQACGAIVSFTTLASGESQTQSAPSGGLSINTIPESVGNYGATSATPQGQFVGTWPSTAEGWINYGTSSTLNGESSTSLTPTYFQNDTNPQQMFTGILSGLQSGTTYYYQACGVAVPGQIPGSICGSIDSFTTTGTSSGTGVSQTACTVSIAANSAFTNQSVSANTNNAEIGSFTITNPCTDSGIMPALKIGIGGFAPISTDVTNLTVSINGNQFGSAIPTLQPSGYIYTFNSNSPVSIPPDQAVTVNVYANLGSSTGTIQATFQPTVTDSVTNQSMLLFIGNGATEQMLTIQ